MGNDKIHNSFRKNCKLLKQVVIKLTIHSEKLQNTQMGSYKTHNSFRKNCKTLKWVVIKLTIHSEKKLKIARKFTIHSEKKATCSNGQS